MSKKIVCPQCGAKRYEKDNFCGVCGAKLKKYCRRCKFDCKARVCGYDKCPDFLTYCNERRKGTNFIN